jgi:hypothetical protein
MIRLPLLILAACILSGCSTLGRKRDWYEGPAELREPTRAAINAAIHHLSRETGMNLKWDWSRDRIEIRLVAPEGQSGWGPVIYRETRNGRQSVLGYAIPGLVVMPRGHGMGTLRHEVGHVVMIKNGNTDQDYHHSLEFFRRNLGTQTY